MKKLLIDFDNTPFDTRQCHASFMNARYGIDSNALEYVNNASLAAIVNKYKNESILTDDDILADIGEYFQPSYIWHREIEPIDDYVVKVLPELAKKYDLVLATARQDHSEDVVRFLIERHFPKCINHMHFVHKRKGYKMYDRVTKRAFVESIGPKHFAGFIDDSTKEITQMQDLISSYLLDTWDLHAKVKGIDNRIRTWKDVGDLYL